MKKVYIILVFVFPFLMANAQSDIRNGYSSFTWSNGERFEGRWVNGTIDGTGVYYWSAEHFYVGYWKNGKRNGFGLGVFEDGSYVVRYFKDDNSSTRELSNIGDINTGVGIYTGEKKSGNACGEGSFKWNKRISIIVTRISDLLMLNTT